MTKVATVDYHYRSGTVEALARSLIVASTLHSGKGPFQLPMTSVQALALGRALEWAARMQATHAAREAALAADVDLARALSREGREALAKAERTLTKAERGLRQQMLICAATMVVSLAGGLAGWAFWWLA